LHGEYEYEAFEEVAIAKVILVSAVYWHKEVANELVKGVLPGEVGESECTGGFSTLLA
jgi:hypothetical protein